MVLRQLVPIAALGMVTSAGCSGDAEPSGDGGSAGTAGAGAGGATVPCDSTSPPDLQGTWAALARYSLFLQSQQGGVVTMCPEGQTAPAYLLMLLEVQPDGASYAVSAIPCQLDLPSVTAMVGECRPDQGNLLTVDIPIPDALGESFGRIPPVPAAISGSPDEALSFDRMRFTWGTRKDTLPSWQQDLPGCGFSDFDAGRTTDCETACVDACDAIVDDDGDAYPGVTVHVCGTTEDDTAAAVACRAEDPTEPGVTLQGKIAMVFRTELELEGRAKSSCEVAGTFASDTTYSVVGADAYLTNTRVSVASALQSLPLFEGDAEASMWRMVRVDGAHGAPDWDLPEGDATARCAVVKTRRNELE